MLQTLGWGVVFHPPYCQVSYPTPPRDGSRCWGIVGASNFFHFHTVALNGPIGPKAAWCSSPQRSGTSVEQNPCKCAGIRTEGRAPGLTARFSDGVPHANPAPNTRRRASRAALGVPLTPRRPRIHIPNLMAAHPHAQRIVYRFAPNSAFPGPCFVMGASFPLQSALPSPTIALADFGLRSSSTP